MRLIARFDEQIQASALIDSLRGVGLDRRDMIVSDLSKEEKYRSFEDAADEVIFIKTEREGLGELGTFAEGVPGLEGKKEGIIVAVETSKHNTNRIREIMEQSGAAQIIQD